VTGFVDFVFFSLALFFMAAAGATDSAKGVSSSCSVNSNQQLENHPEPGVKKRTPHPPSLSRRPSDGQRRPVYQFDSAARSASLRPLPLCAIPLLLHRALRSPSSPRARNAKEEEGDEEGAANSHGGDAAVARAKDAVGSKDAGGSIPGSVAHPTRES